MKETLIEWFGPNYRTTILGWCSRAILGFVFLSQTNPQLIWDMFGNTPFSKWFTSTAITLWLILGGYKDLNTKDRQVAGNNPDNVVEGNLQTKISK